MAETIVATDDTSPLTVALRTMTFDEYIDHLSGVGSGGNGALRALCDGRASVGETIVRRHQQKQSAVNVAAVAWAAANGRNPYVVTDDDRRQWLSRLVVTPADVERIATLAQRTPEWFVERNPRLTASDIGAAAGLAPQWMTGKWGDMRMWLVRKKVWNEDLPPEEAPVEWIEDRRTDLQRGIELEPISLDRIERFLRHHYMDAGARRVRIVHEGLRVDVDAPWLGASNDGWALIDWGHGGRLMPGVDEVINIESKAPRNAHEHIQRHYEAQIMSEMNVWRDPVTRERYADLTVFTEYVEDSVDRKTTALQTAAFYEFDAPRWNALVLPAAAHFYMDGLVRAFIHKERGVLERGHETPRPTAFVDVMDMACI